jgi:integrase
VDSATSAYFVFRFTSPITKRERWQGLGSLSDFSLAEARERARDCRRKLRDGIDPIERSTSSMTFEEAANRYLADHGSKWSSLKHSKQFLSTLRAYVFPKFGKANVASVTTAQVLDVLKPIYVTKAVTAARIRMRIEWVCDWSIVNGHRTAENPARRSIIAAGLPRPAKIVRHFASMPHQDMPAFRKRLRAQRGIAPMALDFLIHTWARTSEVIEARWTEFDLSERLWVIPAERTKTRTEHRVPFSNSALSILKDVPRIIDNPYVFPGPINDCLSNAALSAVLERMQIADVTVHGFRASARCWAEEMTNYPDAIKEMALGHKVGTKVERAYQRSDLLAKRRMLLADWADYLDGNVIRLVATVD